MHKLVPRCIGSPHAAQPPVFVASDDASYFTGAHLRVNRGFAIGSDKT
jgi:hypothetical protein